MVPTCRLSPGKIMKQNKEVKISYMAAHLTTIVSVTLVLLLMGIIALIWISADTETRRLKEKIELSVLLRDSVPDAQVKSLAEQIAAQPYCGRVEVIDKDQALQNWTEETGENLQELFGVNPLSSEISFSVTADYASAPQIAKIKKTLSSSPIVEEVSAPDGEMVDSMNRNIARLTAILAIIAAVMLLISFVLINNTVHLTIYSRRFTIHTMQLVGATNGFIRRPVILNNMLAGLVSGLVAAAMIALALVASKQAGMEDVATYICWWPAYACVAAGLVVAGMLICALAAWVASSRYLRKDYDSLFK